MVGIDRIKFYSPYDWASGSQMQKIPGILDTDPSLLDTLDGNCVIELFNIKEYIDADLAMPDWDETRLEKYKRICKKEIPGYIGKFFGRISNDNIHAVYSDIELEYRDDFWHLFEQYKAYEHVSPVGFESILNDEPVQIWWILKRKRIVDAYGESIAAYLRNHPICAEYIIQEFLGKKEDREKLYFPAVLSPLEKVQIIDKYIDIAEANPNYVALVGRAKSSAELPIDDKLKQKARHADARWVKEHIDLNNGLSYSVSVSFRDVDEPVEYSHHGLNIEIVYGTRWIKEHMDYPTLSNNLIYLFTLVDHSFRCVLVSVPDHMGVFERTIGVKGKDEYIVGSAFHQLDMMSTIQMLGYNRFLQSQGRSLEGIYKWFFEQYLADEFGATGFFYDSPSPSSSTLEKCRALAIAMDSVLKQFRMFCREGMIDRELFEISSEHIAFETIPSLQTRKYVYIKSEQMRAEMNLCFSDQSALTYTKKTGEKYNNFPNMLLKETLSIDDFEHFQKPRISFLMERGLVTEDENGRLNIDINRAHILKELFNNMVICYSYGSSAVKSEIDRLVELGDLEIEDTLFSRPEQDYYNYMLNQSSFSNALDLRNRYLHGTNSRDEKAIEHDYAEFLKLTAIMIIKINEEFCLRFPNDEAS